MNVVVAICLALAVGLYISGPVIDPDLWWHITVGKWIWANAAIPEVDHWNLYATGKPWRAYSWSSEALFAWLDSAWGIEGLAAAKALLGIAVAGSLFYCLGFLAGDWFFGVLLGVFVTSACYNHFTLRPQSMVWIFLIWLIYVLNRISEEGLKKSLLVGLVFIMACWANTHLTTALAMLVVLAWLWGNLPLRDYLVVLAFAFLGTCLTPYLGTEWLTFFSKTAHPFKYQAIAEFKPATILQYSTAFLVILSSLFGLFLHYQPRFLQPTRIFLVLIFSFAGLAITKFLPFAVIIMAAAVAVLWRASLFEKRELGNLTEAIDRLRELYIWLPKQGLGFVFLCMAIVNGWKLGQTPFGKEVVPKAAVDFIEEKKLSHPVLNGFGQGGYLMYRFSDAAGNLEHKVPIDGRTNVNPAEIWAEYYKAVRGLHGWRDFMNRVEPKTILWKTESPMTTLLLEGDEWCRVFWSGDAAKGYSVFVDSESYIELGLQSDNCKV